MADTHQEANVRMLAEKSGGGMLMKKRNDGQKLAHIVKDLVEYPEVAKFLGSRLHEVLPPAKLNGWWQYWKRWLGKIRSGNFYGNYPVN